ncbi:MAG: hypothetical protein IPI60_14450 [Saprospiraceae bacterium]|nr:hypothetical protein [Saprospiraceae bacterium]
MNCRQVWNLAISEKWRLTGQFAYTPAGLAYPLVENKYDPVAGRYESIPGESSFKRTIFTYPGRNSIQIVMKKIHLKLGGLLLLLAWYSCEKIEIPDSTYTGIPFGISGKAGNEDLKFGIEQEESS